MSILKFALRLPFYVAFGTSVVACSQAGGTSSPRYLPGVDAFWTSVSDAAGYRVLHSFTNSDGGHPQAKLLDVNGTLYGTTSSGGRVTEGTVFSITTGGKEITLYSFGTGPHDGYDPLAGLVEVDGTLYGTTNFGGTHDEGTVFSITTGGKEKVIHSFADGADGAQPAAGLLDVKGTLYGTTTQGGANGVGTVFSLTLAGKEKVLHSFGSGSDGSGPVAGLIAVNGTLYGTTSEGGKYYAGTVFSITPSGKEKLLHSFSDNGTDGVEPYAGLVAVKSTLYGTTLDGGPLSTGVGTVFSITTSGKEKILHDFGHGSDGYFSQASLLAVKDTLYGTTTEGGKYGAAGGTVFSMTLSGKEKVLHSFGKAGDGTDPSAGVTAIKNQIYGTTVSGGNYDLGTVFALAY
jgi:uncharacterized repeat protein (TIGR03803 family)